MNKTILDLCGGTGAWSKPYRESGYQVYTITLPDYDIERTKFTQNMIIFVGNKTLKIPKNSVYGILAAPPCTMFSIARNDKTAKEKRDLRKGIKTVQACLNVVYEVLYEPYQVSKNNLKFWALENPASGYLSRFLGKPAFVFDPSDYGDEHSKKTALWGMFNEPRKSKKVVVKKGDENNYVKNVEKYFHLKQHLIPDGYRAKTKLSMRTIVRSITPQGFAKAFYEVNK